MVLCSGCFDGVHAGHVAYLEAARALCATDELLVCAVAPDAYIETAKGRAARWPQPDRLRTIRAMQAVDAAVAQTSPSVASLIQDYRPRIFVKGPDWKDRLPEDVQLACHEVGTAIAFVDTPGTHVSDSAVSDEDALARFEALVLSQQPASEPWTPVTDYSFEARRAIEGVHPQLLIDVFGEGPFLDYGCGPDAILVRLLREHGVMAFGIDPVLNDQWRCVQPHWDPGPEAFVGTFPVIVCREVFEHVTVRDIPRLIRRFQDFNPQFIYLTTRFAQAPTHLLDVDTSDDLDPTHITMLHQTFLRALFVLEGFKRRADLETQMDWKTLGRVLVYERG